MLHQKEKVFIMPFVFLNVKKDVGNVETRVGERDNGMGGIYGRTHIRIWEER